MPSRSRWPACPPVGSRRTPCVAIASPVLGYPGPPAAQLPPVRVREITFRGWKEILARVYGEINEDRVLAVSAGVVFYVLLAIFPGITTLVSLYALFADPITIHDHLAFAAVMMPGDSFNLLQGEVLRIASKGQTSLGLASAMGFLLALWSANAGTKAIFDALNVGFDEVEKRSIVRLNLLSLAFTVGAVIALLVAVAAVVVVPLVLGSLGLQTVGEKLISILRWPVLFALVAMGLSFLYRFGPSPRTVKWHWFTVGSVCASFLWLIGSALFSWYLTNFADYTATYGTLGAAIGLMMWLWLSFVVILVGAKIDAEIAHQLQGK